MTVQAEMEEIAEVFATFYEKLYKEEKLEKEITAPKKEEGKVEQLAGGFVC